MYKKEFENLLSSGSLPNAMLFFGVSDFQIEWYSKKASKLKNVEEPLVFYFDEYNFELAKSHLSQSSLFGGKNALIIKTSSQFPKKELDILISLAQKSSENLLIIECYNDDTKIRSMAKSFEGKDALHVRFFKPNSSEAISFLKFIASQQNIQIEHFALNRLYEAQNEDLGLAVNEFSKLALLEKTIVAQDIDRVVFGEKSINLEDFTVRLLTNKDIKDDLKNINQEDEVRVINFLQSFVGQLCNFYLYMSAYGKCDSAAILGFKLPPKVEEDRSRLARSFSYSNYKELLLSLAEAEFILKKKSNYDKETFLLHVILKLQSSIKNFGKL